MGGVAVVRARWPGQVGSAPEGSVEPGLGAVDVDAAAAAV